MESSPSQVKPEDIRSLLEHFSKTTYKARDSHPKVQQVMQKCLELFGLDYNYSVIPNTLGELSTNYPSSLVILESEKGSETSQGLNNFCMSGNGNNSNGADLLDLGVTNTSVNVNGNGSLDIHEDINGREKSQSPQGISSSSSSGGIDLLLESESFIGSFPTYSFSATTNGNGNGNMRNESSNALNISETNLKDFANAEASKLKDLCSRARFARCRARFPVSVILYKNTHICRSATLSGGPEIYGRSSFDYFFSGGADYKQYNDPDSGGGDDEIVVPETQSDWQLFDRVRSQDIRLLKSFQVHTIVDLMVEKKKVKFGVNVTSSEKVDKENRYAEFNLVSLPYPGCEFFKEYRDKGYNAEDLVFEWNQGHVDAEIFVPTDSTTLSLNTDWTEYRKWDLVTLTQKYLKLLLAYVKSGSKGLLVHCISGWDRTPLFVSLLRLSLWADGVIHKSLSAEQILYLTLAYDWLLFGHNLEDRLSKGEEILFFCFYFLKYIVDGDYSIENNGRETLTFPAQPQPQPLNPTVTVLQPNHPIRVRNDSDIHLDGVLLEGDGCHTSPEGSSWSLSSVESSQSQDNPPAYFQVAKDSSSWEDCNGVQHLLVNHQQQILCPDFSQIQFAQQDDNDDDNSYVNNNHENNAATINIMCESGISVKTIEPVSSAVHLGSEGTFISTGSNVDRTSSISSISSNGISVSVSPSSLSSGVGRTNISSPLSSSRQSPLSLPLSFNSSLTSNQGLENNCFQNATTIKMERTSSMAVPIPNRGHRPESTSSASIGSWQLVTGPGSCLREVISSSDPGSNSSHSQSHGPYAVRLPPNEQTDCIEASESSCTLIEELTPNTNSIDRMMMESMVAVPEPYSENEIDDPLRRPLDLSLEDSISAQFDDQITAITADNNGTTEESPLSGSHVLSSNGAVDGTPTNVTPTKEQETILSERREKLQTVRAHFYTLYASAIGFKFRSVNDNGSSGGGLGFLIGNLLGSSKIAGRALNRTTNL